jgi:hypothetical protein
MYAIDVDDHEVVPNGFDLVPTLLPRGMSKLNPYAEVFEGSAPKMGSCPLLTEG